MTVTPAPLQRIPHDDSRLSWEGAISVERTRAGSKPWRIPHDRRALFPPEFMRQGGETTSGVRLAFRTDSPFVHVRLEPCERGGLMDLACDGEVVCGLPVQGRRELAFDDLPARDKLVELWLPQGGPIRLRGLEVAQGARLAACRDTRPRWVAYGSSITMCTRSDRPTETWPAIVARERGYHLTNLGFGGNCHAEPMMARMIRDRDVDLVSACLGINIYTKSSYNPRTLLPFVIGFVRVIRERHRDVPFIVISPIRSPLVDEKPNLVELTLNDIRPHIRHAVELLRDRGDRNLHYVDGLELFGREHDALIPDGVHPSAEGNRVLARRYLDLCDPIYHRGVIP